RHPGESRGPSFHQRGTAKWIPAFAGMTSWNRMTSGNVPRPDTPRGKHPRLLQDGNGCTPGSAALAVAERVLHLAGELLQAKGLGEEVDVGVLVEPAAEIVLGVAGDEDDLHVGATGADLARQGRPVHPRHHHVGHQEVDAAALAADDLE